MRDSTWNMFIESRISEIESFITDYGENTTLKEVLRCLEEDLIEELD